MRGAVGLLCLLAACGSATGSTTRNFPVGAFDTVVLGGSTTVHVVQGSAPAVVASGDADVLDRLDIAVVGNELRISQRDGFTLGTGSATVTVTAPLVRTARLTGSGDLDFDKVAGPIFAGAVGGSGDLRLPDVKVQQLKLAVTGSGDASATGTADDLAAEVRGSGNIDADRLSAARVTLSVAGSGNATARASTSAELSVSGSGNATVHGTKNCRTNTVGSGSARCTG